MSTPSFQFDHGFFTYEGIKYLIDVRFSYQVGGQLKCVALPMSHIHGVEMSVMLNRLFSDAVVTCDDLTGDVARMIGVFNVECVITFMAYKQQGDGEVNTEMLDPLRQLVHTFIVDNISIVDNEQNQFLYKITMTGKEYYGLLNNVSFTDYNENEMKSVVQLIRGFLVNQGKQNVDKSFDDVMGGVKMHYISGVNDTVQSAIDYVLQKQFYYGDQKDSAMKFLVYDMVDNVYSVFQIGQTPSTNAYNLLMSTNNNMLRDLVTANEIKIVSNSSLRKTDMLMSMSDLTIGDFSVGGNDSKDSQVASTTLRNFFGGPSDNKLQPMNTMFGQNIKRTVSTWDNDVNVYYDFVNIFMNWDSIVVNTGGVIGRRLMQIVNLVMDDRYYFDMNSTTNQVKQDVSRYTELAGNWFITRVRYVIKPSRGVFQQNLMLSRTHNMG